MKLKITFKIIIVFALTFAFVNVNAYGQKRSEKRGVSENNFADPAEIMALAPGVSWFYTWGQTPPVELEEVIGTDNGMQFIPMAWNGSFNEQVLRDYYTKHPDVKYLLGFNEPNFRDQANMTPQEVADLWPVLESIAEDFGLELIGPALNYSPDEPYVNPEMWLDEFLEIYPEARMDYIGLHCYMIQSSAQMEFINRMAEKYNRQVWLTEFCAWDGLSYGDSGYQTQRREMSRKIEDLELSPNVAKYAWFKAKDGSNKHPYYRLLYYRTEPIAQGEYGVLTEMGKIYVNMPTFDPEAYHTVEELIPASEYIKSKNSSLELNSDPESDCILQWEDFGAGCSVSYLVDVPEAGTYHMGIRMASEARRYNPNFKIYTGEELLAEKEFVATGSVDTWVTEFVEVNLPAGKQTITLESTAHTECKLNWINLTSNLTGIDSTISVNAQLQLYKEAGELCVASENVVSRIEIVTVGGQTIKVVSGQNKISLSGITTGVYLIRIGLADGTVSTCKYVL